MFTACASSSALNGPFQIKNRINSWSDGVGSAVGSEAWSYGRVDCQLSKGKCSSYVAGYVNSSVLVPKVLTLPTLCPFCVHSQKLGQGFLQGERTKVYSLAPEQFVKRSIVTNGRYKEFDVWRSAYAYFYPKCKGWGE